jgi:hypothetical protein
MHRPEASDGENGLDSERGPGDLLLTGSLSTHASIPDEPRLAAASTEADRRFRSRAENRNVLGEAFSLYWGRVTTAAVINFPWKSEFNSRTRPRRMATARA